MSRRMTAGLAGWIILSAWAVVALATIACVGSSPSKMKGKVDLTTGEIELETTEVVVVEAVTGTPITRHEINVEETEMGVLGWVTLGFGIIGLLNTASPKGLKNLWTFIRPGSEWSDTRRAGLALLGVRDSPQIEEPAAKPPVGLVRAS